MLNSNVLALILTLVIAIFWLRVNDFIAHKGWISSQISRKIIHIGTGPIFVLCWLLYNNASIARYLAAVVPLGITLQFVLVGSGIIKDTAAVEAMSRTGNREEILQGPFFYGIVFILLTIGFWRNTAIGIVALMILCGGDGAADMIGKLITSPNLPWSAKKTVAGSLTMFTGGYTLSLAMVWIYIWQGYIDGPMTHFILPIGLISLAAAFIESLPYENIDNITVPLVSVLLGLLIL